MELNRAIAVARDFAKTVLPYSNLSVEEVEYDDQKGEAWLITFGYKRELPAEKAEPVGASTSTTSFYDQLQKRHSVRYEDVYRVVRIPFDGTHPSMKIRKT